MADFSFRVVKKDPKSLARAGVIKTRNGNIQTPYLVPVATLATVRSIDSSDLVSLGAQCTLANTYHLHFRPGEDVIKKAGGLHKFMNFHGPIFTDSGGFQAFSLGYGREHNITKLGFFPGGQKPKVKGDNYAKVTDSGVTFTSVYDGTKDKMGPKESMKIQSDLGADIIMAFDECTSPLSDYEYTKVATKRTHRWALESLKYHDKKQALYGIIQGGWFKDLREESMKFILSHPFDGIAIGGSLGKSKKDMLTILDWMMPHLDSRPIHLLGIGEIEDLFEGVLRGVDTFDCVAPTRTARRGSLYVSPKEGGTKKNRFRINIKNSRFKEDFAPIDKYCKCPTCKGFTRAYLRHLYRVNEIAYFRLATIHNVHFILDLMKQIRKSILDGSFHRLMKKWLK